MGRKISSFSIKTLIVGIGMSLCMAPAFAQSTLSAPTGNRPANRPSTSSAKVKKEEKKDDAPVYPLYNGIDVGVDLWGLGSKAFGSNFLSSEVAVDVNLKNRFFPVVELGHGSTDSWSDEGIHYKSSAPFFRIGLDYNAFYKKKFQHKLLAGLRYGFSSFSYDIESLSINDPVYGGGIHNPNLPDEIWGGTIPFKHEGMKGNMQWLEICLGIRAHIWKDLYMGWTARYRFRLSASPDRYGDPWYVPGFGEYKSKVLGITYTITYKLPF